MKTNELVLRCYVQEEGSWVAVCLDLNLAAQAETEGMARKKLEEMTLMYVREALTTDREYADQLLSRKAPLRLWVRYYVMLAMSMLHKNHNHTFHEVMPMRPA